MSFSAWRNLEQPSFTHVLYNWRHLCSSYTTSISGWYWATFHIFTEGILFLDQHVSENHWHWWGEFANTGRLPGAKKTAWSGPTRETSDIVTLSCSFCATCFLWSKKGTMENFRCVSKSLSEKLKKSDWGEKHEFPKKMREIEKPGDSKWPFWDGWVTLLRG